MEKWQRTPSFTHVAMLSFRFTRAHHPSALAVMSVLSCRAVRGTPRSTGETTTLASSGGVHGCQECNNADIVWSCPGVLRVQVVVYLLLVASVLSVPQGHEGYPKAEVTGGGVPLEQVDCRTMQSRVRQQLMYG
jgi:hypothetical protein